MAWDAIGTGVRLAGALHAALLLGYAAIAMKPPWRAAVPVAYAACLLGALLAPVAAPGLPLALASSLWLGLPAATYALVIQVTDKAPLGRFHAWVLIVPAPAVAGAVAWGGAGVDAIGVLGPRIPFEPLLRVHAVVTGAALLAAVLVLRHRRLMTLAAQRAERPRYALIAAIVAMQAVMLGLNLLALADVAGDPRTRLATAVVQVALLYLVGTALFRLPARAPGKATPAGHAATAASAATDPSSAFVSAPDEPAQLSEREQELLREARRLMAEQKLYREPGFARRDLAEALGVPEYRVTRLLNLGLGQSFTRFVNSYRVAEARQHLLTSDLQITQVAFATGFNSLATFHRVFKKQTGFQPTTYRADRRTT